MQKEIKNHLFELQDKKYKEFQSGLCPNTENIIGVRIPILRDYAKDIAKQTRDEVKGAIKKITEKILIFNSKEANQDINDMYEILKKLEKVILEFGEKFAKRKKEKNIVDFGDVEHFALQILLDEETKEPTEIAKKYQEKFEEIAIDEY